MFREFEQFLLRGNVIDLAVGVVIGSTFGTVVTTLVKGFLTPLIGAIVKVPNFSELSFTINESTFLYGEFLNASVSFVLMTAAIFFLVVKPTNVLVSRSRKGPPADPTTKKCKECLSEIPLEARRCAYCTEVVA